MSENEIRSVGYENSNQKFLMNSGVCCYFGNAISSNGEGKLPMIKSKLRKILVDFGLVQTCLEINQQLGYIKVWYRDLEVEDLRGSLLQKFNQSKNDHSVEVIIDLNSCSAPKTSRPIRTYNGLTKLLYQEFIQSAKSVSMIDDNPYNQMKELIKQGNLSPSEPLESIFRGELD